MLRVVGYGTDQRTCVGSPSLKRTFFDIAKTITLQAWTVNRAGQKPTCIIIIIVIIIIIIILLHKRT